MTRAKAIARALSKHAKGNFGVQRWRSPMDGKWWVAIEVFELSNENQRRTQFLQSECFDTQGEALAVELELMQLR